MQELAARGLEAKDRNDWKAGYDLLTKAIDEEPENPELLSAIAQCAWWLQRYDRAFEYRHRAYAACYRIGDRANAARVAVKLACDYFGERGQLAVAKGWLSSAAELLSECPECRAHAELELARGLQTPLASQGPKLQALDRAIQLARRYGARDVEMMASHAKGQVLIAHGRIDEGLELMDRAAAAAVGEHFGPYASTVIYCQTIAACEAMGDLERATEWSEVTLEHSERNAVKGWPDSCRVHRAAILRLRGAWAEAEAEARLVVDVLRATPGVYALAVGELAEIQRRRGDLETAWGLAAEAVAAGTPPEPTLSLLVADREGVEAAYYRLAKALRVRAPNRFYRAWLIPAFTEIAILCGRPEAAEKYVADLEESAALARTPFLLAFADSARGRLLAAQGDLPTARSKLEAAVERWTKTAVPFEAARDRLALAELLLAAGDRAGAATEAGEAVTGLARLGAAAELAKARRLLARTLKSRGAYPLPGGLSRRELEVVGLIGRGLSSAEIAPRLFISKRTADSHVDHIRNKLGLGSRKAIAAWAAAQGLVRAD
jgi:ATP/maltotriose-dependent transcriptional regulator MalT